MAYVTTYKFKNDTTECSIRVNVGTNTGEFSCKLPEFAKPYISVENNTESHLVLNVSTLTETLLEALAQAGVDLSRVWATHNYYPKVYSGLSQAYVLAQNQRLHALGILCLAFVSGQMARDPYFDGLCTVEQTRHWPSQQTALYLPL